MSNEPQEESKEARKSVSTSLVEKSQKYGHEMTAVSNDLPGEIIAGAEQKLVRLHQVNSEVDDKMAVVYQTLREIRQIIRSNLHNKGILAGVLTQEEAQYMACLELKYRELEELFGKDEHKLA